MSKTDERTVALPDDLAAYVDERVASGAYGSASEVVGAALRSLQERDGDIELWLRDDVAPVCRAMDADRSRALTGEEVFADLERRHQHRMTKRA